MDCVKDIREFVISNFLFGDADSLKEDVCLLDSGIIDSTGMLELIMFLEQKYSLKILDEEMVPENLDSVNRIVQFLGRKLPVADAGESQTKQTQSPQHPT